MKCIRCGLFKTVQSVCLMGQGPTPCNIMIVGEAPGFREDDLNKPFQGDCGEELDRILESTGMTRDKVYITNVVHCRPPNNRKPTKKEIRQCLYWFNQELDMVKPKFILLLGATAVSGVPYFNDKGKITQLRGKFYQVDDKVFMPTFHPGAILRDERKKPLLETDILRFIEASKENRFDKPMSGFLFHIAQNMHDISLIFNEIEKEKYISLDVETQGLNPISPPEAKIKCLGLGLKKKQWIIPLNHLESPFKTEKIQKMILTMIWKVLKDKLIIAQNGKFDSKWLLLKYGLDFWISHDVMMMHYLLDENDQHGLKYLASKFCGASDYSLTPQEMDKVPFAKLAKYCALDVFYTRKLCMKFLPELQDDPVLYRFYKKVIIPVVNVYRDIEMNGIYVDLNKMSEAKNVLIKNINLVKKKLNQYGDINWNSTQQLSKLLFNDIGLDPIEKTKEGYSTNESVLKILAKKHELPKLVLDYRESYGLLTKFITGWEEKLVDNMLYPSFKLTGTVTGRPSCEEPNLQQTPRDPRIRSLITAPQGWTLVEFDFGQIELRIAAMLANEKAMKLAFQTGQDIHTKTATLITGIDMSMLSGFEAKEWRKKAKSVNFGFVYGMGAETFIEYARDKYDIEFKKSEAIEFRKAFFSGYPDLEPWYEKQKRIARINKCVRNLAGRIRHLPDIEINFQAELQAINSPVQGLASDFTLMSVIEIHKKFSPDIARICGTVHDAILIRIKNKHLKEVIPQIIKIMESPELFKELQINPTVPIVANASIGPWGKGEEWNGK